MDVGHVEQGMEHIFRCQPGFAVALQAADFFRVVLLILAGIPNDGRDMELKLGVMAVKCLAATAVVQRLAVIGNINHRGDLFAALQRAYHLRQKPVSVQNRIVIAII